MLLPDKKHMVLVKDNAWLLKVDLENKMRVIKKIKLPGADENLLIGSQLTGNGGRLILWRTAKVYLCIGWSTFREPCVQTEII